MLVPFRVTNSWLPRSLKTLSAELNKEKNALRCCCNISLCILFSIVNITVLNELSFAQEHFHHSGIVNYEQIRINQTILINQNIYNTIQTVLKVASQEVAQVAIDISPILDDLINDARCQLGVTQRAQQTSSESVLAL